MPHSIWETIAETPWWVYAMLIYFLQISLQALKPRTIPIKYFLPPFILFLSFSLLIFATTQNNSLISYFFAFCLGILLGWLQFSLMKIKAIKGTSLLYIPGSWGLLILFILLVAIRIYYGYPSSAGSTYLLTTPHLLFAVDGFFTGLMLGRLLYAWRCIKNGPYRV